MARALYDSGPSDTHLVAFGLSRADIPEVQVKVWSANWQTFEVMCAMGTQWRTGACGATGLDYGALPTVMELMAIPSDQRSSIFHDIQWMEAQALAAMADASASH